MSQEKFGEKLGVGKAAISKLENNERGLTDTMAKLICTTFNVNEKWLRTGEGDMIEKISPDNSIIEMATTALKQDKQNFQKDFLYLLSQLTEEQWAGLENVMDIMVKNIKNNKNNDDKA